MRNKESGCISTLLDPRQKGMLDEECIGGDNNLRAYAFPDVKRLGDLFWGLPVTYSHCSRPSYSTTISSTSRTSSTPRPSHFFRPISSSSPLVL